MSDWIPKGYLIFEKERSRPALDLVMHIDHPDPVNILDVGCGPGNSTNILYTRWKNAKITGIDSSQAMIDTAKKTNSAIDWILCDAGEDLSHLGQFDIIFSNAAFQWIPGNDILIPRLFNMLNPDGILAAQIPYVKEMPIHNIIMNLVSSSKWSEHFEYLSSTYKLHSPGFYYDILCGVTKDINLWETRYFHVMNSYDDILQWYSCTGLRPYLDCLHDDKKKMEFKEDISTELKKHYIKYKDGKILFPFNRIFFIAKYSQ